MGYNYMKQQTLCYTDERNAQIVIELLKAHGITRVVASPGATNARLVWMLQCDGSFTLYSAVDERHASYLACGIAEETNEPVVISCTGATSSRNYMSALTEAYYRKLPILAITSSMPICRLGHMWPQMTDRTNPPSDTVRLSVQCPIPNSPEEARACEVTVNRAILELRRHGGGPVHINLETKASGGFLEGTPPLVHKIMRITENDVWPELPSGKRIAVWIGSHMPFSDDETVQIERFAESNNAVVFADRTSNYFGKSVVNPALLFSQSLFSNPKYEDLCPDLVIHIGEISGDYPTFGQLRGRCEVWRVNEDGELRDFLQRLTTVFEMPERSFFSHYAKSLESQNFLDQWKIADDAIRTVLPEIPFSNLWIASQLSDRLPQNSEIHFGILNSLRSWNMFRSNGIVSFCNVGGFGIDGCVSSMIGASFIHRSKLYFGVFGDLAFFYDLNSIGNRHIGKNLRILVINNGIGVEFANPGSIGTTVGDNVRDYIAAGEHFANKSRDLLRHMAGDLGFRYISASSKEECAKVKDGFLAAESDKPILMECFVDANDDATALSAYRSIEGFEPPPSIRSSLGKMLPPGLKNVIRRVGL